MPAELKFIERDTTTTPGGSVVPLEHVVSTRRASGGPLRPVIRKGPVGRWTLVSQTAIKLVSELTDWLSARRLSRYSASLDPPIDRGYRAY
jgi:hypothetical protein